METSEGWEGEEVEVGSEGERGGEDRLSHLPTTSLPSPWGRGTTPFLSPHTCLPFLIIFIHPPLLPASTLFIVPTAPIPSSKMREAAKDPSCSESQSRTQLALGYGKRKRLCEVVGCSPIKHLQDFATLAFRILVLKFYSPDALGVLNFASNYQRQNFITRQGSPPPSALA